MFFLPINIRHFQFTAYADVDTYVDTYADLKYRGRVSIFFNDWAVDMQHILVLHDQVNIYRRSKSLENLFYLGFTSRHGYSTQF